MKSKALKTDNLPEDREIEYRINAKPFILLGLIIVFGTGMMFYPSFVYIGAAVVAIGLFALLFLPSRVLLEFSNDYVVVYHRVNQNECELIYYDEIVSYQYVRNPLSDYLVFELENGETIRVSCFGKTRIEMILNRYAKDKKKKTNV